MFKLKPSLALALLFLTIVSCNNKPSDNDIQDNVSKQLKDNKNYTGVTSTVKDGVVTLTGTCEGDNCAQRLYPRQKHL